MTQGFAPVVRRLPPAVPTADITVEAPPDLPPPVSHSLVPRLVPVVMSVASMGVMAAAFVPGSAVARNPMFMAFPMMMLVSTVVTVVSGRARRRGGGIDADRIEYLGYLSRLRKTVTETAMAQRRSLNWSHPDPDTVWTLIGGPRMWERRKADPDFCLVRVGVGTRPLATRLVAPQTSSGELSDPVTVMAVRRFIDMHSTIAAPITIGLRGSAIVTIDGDATSARGVLRAMICQLAVLHPPDQLLIIGAISDRNRAHWDWLKWLPHNQHPAAFDEVGSVRMVYRSAAAAAYALAGVRLPQVVVADLDEGADGITGVTTLEIGTGCRGAPLTIRWAGRLKRCRARTRWIPSTR